MNHDVDKQPLKVGSYVVNLDKDSGNGSHWVALCISPRCIFYIDPLGTELSGFPTKSVVHLSQMLKLPLQASKMNIQPADSNFCGEFSMYIAKRFNEALKTGTLPNSVNKFVSRYFKDGDETFNVSKLKV